MEESVSTAESGVVRFLDGLVAEIVGDFVIGSVVSVRTELVGFLPLLMTVYVALWGYRMIGGLGAPRSLALELVKLSAVLVLLLHFEAYNRLIVEPVFRLPDDLAAVMVGRETGAGVVTLVDEVLTEGFRVGADYWEEAGVLTGGVGLYLVAIMIWIAVVLPTALAAFLILLSKLYLGVLVAVGPAVILLTLFERTRGVFDRWVSEILTKSLTVMLAIMVPRILLHHFLANLQDMSAANMLGQHSVATVLVVLFFAVAQILFYWQVPSLAAALGGGLQLAPIGIDRRLQHEVLTGPAGISDAAAQHANLIDRIMEDYHAGVPGAAPFRFGPRWMRPW